MRWLWVAVAVLGLLLALSGPLGLPLDVREGLNIARSLLRVVGVLAG